MKRSLLSLLLLACISLFGQEIASGCKSDYVIVTKENAPKVTAYCASHLKKYVKLVAGVDMPIATARPQGKKAIYIGAHGELPKTDAYNPEKYQNSETFRITALPDGSISIMGCDSDDDWTTKRFGPFGLMWGTYSFIERFLGVRWYAPGDFGECYEKKDKVTVAGLPIEVTPNLYHRNMWPQFFLDFKNNDSWEYCRHLRAFGKRNMSANHSMNDLVYYAKDQDEIFALEADGKTRNRGVAKRVREDGVTLWAKEPQYCFSNPATFKAFCDFIDAVYEKRPEAALWKSQRPNADTIVVVPNDNFSYHPCHCPNCQVLIDKGKGKAAMSNLVWGFVKKVAEWAKVKYPGKVICTLAYEAYRLPPDFDLPDNVVVQICISPYIIHHGFPEYLKEADENVKAWSNRCKELQVWHYVMPFDTYPYAMPHIMYEWHARYPQIKACFLELNNSKRGLTYLPRNVSDSIVYDLPQTHLNLYFAMKAMAGEKMDVDQELELYYRMFWGPAYEPMKRFCETQQNAWEHINITTNKGEYSKLIISGYKLYEEVYPAKVIKTMNDCFAQAKKLVAKGSIYDRRLDWIYMGYLKAFTENAETYARELKCSSDVVLFNKDGAPVIDGKLDDDFWKGLPSYSFQKCAVPLPATFGTTFKMAATKDKLYFGIEASDPHAQNQKLDHTTHDFDVFMDDSVELFFKPGNKAGKRVYNVTVNALGTVLDYAAGDIRLDRSYESGVEVKTTRGEAGYTVELAIPIKNLHLPENGVFGLNIGRNKMSGVGEVHETTAWRCTFAGFWNFENMPNVTLSSMVDVYAEDYAKPRSASVKIRKMPGGKAGALVSEGCRYEQKDGVLTLFYKMPKDGNPRDYGAYAVPIRKNAKTGGRYIEIRFRNPDPKMNHQFCWSYIDANGKLHADWLYFCKSEKHEEWRVYRFDMLNDGSRAKERKKKGEEPYPEIKEMRSLDVMSTMPKDELERHIDIDYIRVY